MDKDLAFARFTQALDYLEYKRIIVSQVELAGILGVSESALSSAKNNKDRRFSKPFLKKFAIAFSDYINEDWLLKGEGEMIKPERNLRPHFQAKAAAGFMDGIAEGEYGDDMRPKIPFLRDYDFTIGIEGESMLPDYRDGDILACRIYIDYLNPPIGKVCVIDSKDGPVVKEIVGVNEYTIVCHSINPNYKDYEVDFSNINRIAVVVGAVRETI